MKSTVGNDKVVVPLENKRGTESRKTSGLVLPPRKKVKAASSTKTPFEHTRDYLSTASEKELDKLAKWLNTRKKTRAKPQDTKQQTPQETIIPPAMQPALGLTTAPQIIRNITPNDVDQMKAALFPETVVATVPRKQKLGDR